jgi:hypothetical protein
VRTADGGAPDGSVDTDGASARGPPQESDSAAGAAALTFN